MTSKKELKNRLNKHYLEKINRVASLSKNKENNQFLQYNKTEMKHPDYGDVCLLIEYETTRPEYGIYFGCKCDARLETSTCGNILKKNIWDAYKKAIYRDIQVEVEMEDVFLPNCEATPEGEQVWLFWIRLEEYLNVTDAENRLSVLVDIFKNNNFCQVSECKPANPE